MTARAPERDVVRVLECAGPRGGILYVHVLSCGCFRTFRKVMTKATCIACFAVEQLSGVTADRFFQVYAAVRCSVCGKLERCRVYRDQERETPKIVLPTNWRYGSRGGDMGSPFTPVCGDACHAARENGAPTS